MATKIRLARRGRKKRPVYDIIIADSRAPRDGKYIEKIGLFNPNVLPKELILDEEKAFEWVMTGAQPTETVRTLLSTRGIMLKKHLQVGVNKGAITQEVADQKFAEWKANKDSQLQGDADKVSADKAAAEKAIIDAEKEKVAKEVAAEEEAKKAAEAEAAAKEAEAKAAAEAEAAAKEAEAPATEEPAADEAES